MPQTVKGELFQWFKVDLDMWGRIAPPDKSRFAPAIRDDVYLDIGAPGRCVRNFYVENILDCEGNPWVASSGVGEHALVSAAHTDVVGTPTSGQFLSYDGTNWRPADVPDVGEGARYVQAANTVVQYSGMPLDRILFDEVLQASGISHASGIFTLSSGVYSLNCQVDFAGSGYGAAWQWYDRTTSGYIGTLGLAPDGPNQAVAVHVFSGAHQVECRLIATSGQVDITTSGTTAWILAVGGSGPPGEQGPQGPEGPQGPPGTGGSGGALYWSGLLDVQNVQWTSGQGVVHNGSLFVPINLYEAFAASGVFGDVFETRTLSAGAGLVGGGDLSADRTFDVGAGWGITVNPNDIEVNTADLDTRYQLSGTDTTRGEIHDKLLGSGETCTVQANEQLITVWEYLIGDGATLLIEENGEQIVLNDAGSIIDVEVSGIPPFKSASIEFPASGTNVMLFRAPKNITILDVTWSLFGDNTSIGISGAIRHGSTADRFNGAGTELFTGGFIAMPVSGSTAAFNDATVTSGAWLWFQANWNDPVGDVDEAALHINYLETI